jgi:hypothetical protein
MRYSHCVFALLAAAFCVAEERPRAAELDRLASYIGEWDLTQTVRWKDQPEVVYEGVLIVEWLLDKQFMRFYLNSKDEKNPLSSLQIVGFDAVKRVYRLWSYGSDGVTYDANGEWKAQRKRWEWNGKVSNGLDMTNVDGFIDDDTFEFVTEVFDSAGNRLAECIGRGKRKKKQEPPKQP